MNATTQPVVDSAEDVCALPLVRRLAAMLDRDPATLGEGDALPRGWHAVLFNAPTRQSRLRADGAPELGVTLPDIGLPRLMLGGRRWEFAGDIPIGARVQRETRQSPPEFKTGRSGRIGLFSIEHRLRVGGATAPAVIERLDYLLLEARDPVPPATPAPAVTPATPNRTLTPDEALLFRYSALTDNPHRIHYDAPYATTVEGYPALVVNGSIPTMFLLELFRAVAGREPAQFRSRNVAPMYCGRTLGLHVLEAGGEWRLWVTDADGRTTFDAQAH